MSRQQVPQDVTNSPAATPSGPVVWATALDKGFSSLQKAVDALVEAGEESSDLLLRVEELEVEGLVVPAGLFVTVEGQSPDGTLLTPTRSTQLDGPEGAWLQALPKAGLVLKNLVFDGSGYLIDQAVRFEGPFGVFDCTFQNIGYQPQGPSYQGTAIACLGRSGLEATGEIENCRFTNIGRIGIYMNGVSGSIYAIEYQGKGDGASQLDYAIELENGSTVLVCQCDVSACTGFAGDSKSSGFLIFTSEGSPTEARIDSCNIHGNNTGIQIGVGLGFKDTSEVQVQGCRIVDNEIGIDSFTDNQKSRAQGNWWGSNSGPGDRANRGRYPLPADHYLQAELAVAEVADEKIVNLWTSTTDKPPTPTPLLDIASGYLVFVSFADAHFHDHYPPVEVGNPPLVHAGAQADLGTLTPQQQPFLRQPNLLGGPGTRAFTLATQQLTGVGQVTAEFDHQDLALKFELQQPPST